MTKDEAMKLALEALSCIESPLYVSEINKVGAAMKALRQAIEQENVVSSDTSQERVDETAKQRHEQEPDDLTAAYMSGFYDGKNKYAPQPKPKQEPVAWWDEEALDDEFLSFKTKDHTVPLYTAPPQRQWVGLTADEIWKCNKAQIGSAVEVHICSAHQNVLDFAEAIEAKLREKNGIAHGIKGEA
jgi:hypothetical protein